MNRQRILLLENDGPLQGVLCDLFGYEDLDVTVCTSLAELQVGVKQYPTAAVVSDSWAMGDYQVLSPKHRTEIIDLARTAEIVLTTGQRWGRQMLDGELGTVAIVEKPYDMDRLMSAVRAALERSSSRQLAVHQ
jgi:DNA-binding NtrC family response regulator